MRDIPKINYNTSVKNKNVANENEANGILTRCTFKSYKDFLENYESKNTKDDQESVSSTDSGISDIKSYSTSTSSLNSENGSSPKVDGFSGGRTGSFRNYLENYNNKKFSSVKAITNKKNVIKSEIVIQVNAPQEFVPAQEERDIPDFPPPSQPPPLKVFEEIAPVSVPPPPPLIAPPPTPPTIPPPPPPLCTNLNQCTPKKWAPVEIENQPVREKQVSNNSTAATNLAAILTQNALFKRKAHESEKVIECKPVPIEKPPTPQPVVNHNTLPRAKAPEFINHRTITIEVPLKNSPPKSVNDVDYSTTTVVPITDKNTKVKTNDPNVKKMVYNTYRGLLGAYNNKANDMIATLPRTTMVKEDRGISKQLESIALQGGLEKINGRTNAKVETD